MFCDFYTLRTCIFFLLTLSLLWSSFFFLSPLWLFPPLLFQICNMSQHVPTSLLMQRWKLGQSWHTVGSYVDQVYRWHQIAAVSCVRSCDICLSSKHQAWKVSGAQSAKQEFFFRQHSIAFQRWSKIHQIPGRNITVCIPGFVPCVSMRRHTFYNQNCAANAFLLPSLGRWFHIV